MHSSFVQVMAEFQAEGHGAPDDDSMIGSEIRAGGWDSIEGFAAFVARLRADADLARSRP